MMPICEASRPPFVGTRADQAHRPLGILERRARRPATVRQAVIEGERRHAVVEKPGGGRLAFPGDADAPIAAATKNQDRGAIGFGWPLHHHARCHDVGDGTARGVTCSTPLGPGAPGGLPGQRLIVSEEWSAWVCPLAGARERRQGGCAKHQVATMQWGWQTELRAHPEMAGYPAMTRLFRASQAACATGRRGFRKSAVE